MNDEDEIWLTYAKGVKKIAKAIAPSKTSFPRKREPIASDPAPQELRRTSSAQSGVALAKPGSEHMSLCRADARHWIPAFAGMTQKDNSAHNNLNRRIERDLRHGHIAIQARIDLHSMTQVEAHHALAQFMASAAKSGKRYLLIITGKGRANAGVLKTNLPGWLQSLPVATQILALRPAAPKHGGDGAFYVILKRKKESRE